MILFVRIRTHVRSCPGTGGAPLRMFPFVLHPSFPLLQRRFQKIARWPLLGGMLWCMTSIVR